MCRVWNQTLSKTCRASTYPLLWVVILPLYVYMFCVITGKKNYHVVRWLKWYKLPCDLSTEQYINQAGFSWSVFRIFVSGNLSAGKSVSRDSSMEMRSVFIVFWHCTSTSIVCSSRESGRWRPDFTSLYILALRCLRTSTSKFCEQYRVIFYRQ